MRRTLFASDRFVLYPSPPPPARAIFVVIVVEQILQFQVESPLFQEAIESASGGQFPWGWWQPGRIDIADFELRTIIHIVFRLLAQFGNLVAQISCLTGPSSRSWLFSSCHGSLQRLRPRCT